MTPDEYLQDLRDQLRIFSHQEQAVLLEEIGSHLESGEADTRMGKDAEQRRQKALDEMGSPEQMGHGFKKVHRPDGWIDYLLVILPIIINLLAISYFRLSSPSQVQAYRLAYGLMCTTLVLVGFLRRTTLLMLTWAIAFLGWIVTILISSEGYLLPIIKTDLTDFSYVVSFITTWQVTWFKGLPTSEVVFWFLMLAGVLFLLGMTLWRHRRDLLIVSYGIVTPVVLVCSYLIPLLNQQTGWDQHIQGVKFSSVQSMMVWLDSALIIPVLTFALLGVLFLASNRTLRWAALIAYLLFGGLQNTYLYRPSIYVLPEYFQSLILPLAIVLLCWGLERNKRRRLATAS